MIKSSKEEGLVLGVIRNTDDMALGMDEEYKIYYIPWRKWFILKEKFHILDLKSMHHYPHIGVFGGSGSGNLWAKSYIRRVMQQKYSYHVLDPHLKWILVKKHLISKRKQ